MDKSQRNYRLSVQIEGGQVITIEPPFTVEFDVTRNNLASTNVGQFKIYNLGRATRRKIAKDDYQYSIYRRVQFDAGYGKNLATCFKGNANHIWSVREGVNYITTAEAFDGGDALINGKTDLTVPAGTPVSSVLQTVMSKGLPNTTIGAISKFPDLVGGSATGRGNTYSGNTAKLLSSNSIVAGAKFFIDNEKSYLLKDDDYVTGGIPVISSDSGLLNTPVRSNQKLFIDILFEPRIQMCQIIQLKSTASISSTAKLGTADNFNGNYKVVSIHHRGMISDSISGDAVTSLGLWLGDDGPVNLNPVPNA